ncbi:MurR/RpiR family transcriptional regulator [Paenibacillus silviterrae]|uniref:MurR/RpiR family transcriptional regulator n=1 Tax=Paenibacillus silviterrae TaxID=3242194 RepID=UPI002542BF4F|nr:MurR/RpiR family transcriptional regulator [Paenibacillus chinjuensis]
MSKSEVSAIQVKINSLKNALTASESKVAEFIRDRFEQVIYLSVTDLAEQADVGETTVLRFCRKLGYKGYQEFKLALAQNHAVASSSIVGGFDENDEIQAIMQKAASANIKALQETMTLLDSKKVEEVAILLLSARRIHFYGVGVSGITAVDAKSKFLRIGIATEAVTDSHLQAMSAATLGEKDVAIGLTVSGSTKDTIDALRIAKENGAGTVAITQFAKSPITKTADHILLTAGKELPFDGGSVAGKMAQLLVIDILFSVIATRIKEKAQLYKEKTAKAVVDKIY